MKNRTAWSIFGVLVAGATVAILVLREHFQARLHEQNEELVRQADQIAQLEAENERLSNRVAQATSGGSSVNNPSRELLRLRGEVGLLRQETNQLSRLHQENARLSQALAESDTNQVSANDLLTVRKTHAVDAMSTLLQAIKNFAANHNGQCPNDLHQLITSGDLGATNFMDSLKLADFQLGQAAGTDPQGNPAVLRVEIPNPKPGGGSVMIVGGFTADGVPHTSVWNVSPKR
jgi:hypothetical protein